MRDFLNPTGPLTFSSLRGLVAQASQNLAFSRLNHSKTDSILQGGRLEGKKKVGAGFTDRRQKNKIQVRKWNAFSRLS